MKVKKVDVQVRRRRRRVKVKAGEAVEGLGERCCQGGSRARLMGKKKATDGKTVRLEQKAAGKARRKPMVDERAVPRRGEWVK